MGHGGSRSIIVACDCFQIKWKVSNQIQSVIIIFLTELRDDIKIPKPRPSVCHNSCH